MESKEPRERISPNPITGLENSWIYKDEWDLMQRFFKEQEEKLRKAWYDIRNERDT